MVSSAIQLSPGAGGHPRSEAAPQAAAKQAPYQWIVNPWFDFLFVYGGTLWLMWGAHYLTYGWNIINAEMAVPGAFGMSIFLIATGTLGQHLFADSHTVATYMRIYATPESRKTFKLYAYYLPWLSLTLFTLALLFPDAAGLVVYIHLMWVYQHYVGQCFGIGLIYCYKRKYYMNNFERESFRWFMHSISFLAIALILTDRNFSPYVYYSVQLPFYDLPAWLTDIGRVMLVTTGTLFAANVARKYYRDGQMIPMPTLALIFTVAMMGLAGGMFGVMIWVYGPAFFHGSQYLAVSLGFYLKEKGIPEGMLPKDVFKEWLKPRAFKYIAYVVVAGMFIYIFVPHFMTYFGFTFGLVATVIQACINFHHFVSDAAIWRLRDKRCREILIA